MFIHVNIHVTVTIYVKKCDHLTNIYRAMTIMTSTTPLDPLKIAHAMSDFVFVFCFNSYKKNMYSCKYKYLMEIL